MNYTIVGCGAIAFLALSASGLMFVNLLRMKRSNSVSSSSAFSRLITKVLADSVSARAVDLKPVIQQSLEDIARYYNVDYAHILVSSDNSNILTSEFVWSRLKSETTTEPLQTIDLGHFAWLSELLQRCSSLCCGTVDELISLHSSNNDLPHILAGLKSLTFLPLRLADNTNGCLFIGALDERGKCNVDEKARLLAVADSFAGSVGRWRIAQALSESDQKYRITFENAPMGIYQNTVDGQIIRINQKLASIFGADSVETFTSRITDIASEFYVRPEERANLIMSAMASQGFVTAELLQRRLDGTIITIRSKIRAVRDNTGKPIYLEGFLEDISEQKQTMEALEEAVAFDELATNLLADFASCPSYEIDAQIDEALAQIARFVGVDHALIVLISDDRQSLSCGYEFAESGEHIWRSNYQNIPIELDSEFGSLVREPSVANLAANHLSTMVLTECSTCVSIPILLPYGALKGILKLGSTVMREEWKESDVSRLRIVAEAIANVLHRARVEAAVVASEYNYRSIFENAPLGIFQSTGDGKVISVNEQLARYMFYSSAEEAVSSISDLRTQIYVDPEDRDAIIADVHNATGFVSRECRLYRKDGSIFIGAISMRLVRSNNKEAEFLEGFIEDVTLSKDAEDSLQRRFEIDKLITKIVADFASCDIADVDETINFALQQIAGAFDAEHSYILSVSEDATNYSAIFEWTDQDITLMKSYCTNVPFGTTPWTEQMLMSDQVINLSRLTTYPVSFDPHINGIATNSGRKSTLAVPIYGKAGSTAGAICLASYTKEVVWSDSDVAKLRIAGDSVAGVVERKRADAVLKRQAEYDKLVRSTLARFATCLSEEIDTSVDLALADIAACFGGDDISLTLFSENNSKYSCTHEWVAAGYTPVKDRFQNVPIGTFAYLENRILANETVVFGEIDTSEFGHLRHGAQPMVLDGIKSLLYIPVYGVAGTIIGAVGISAYSRAIEWTAKDIDHIRVVGNAIANVIERKKADAALKRSAAFDELIATILADFAASKTSDFSQTANNALSKIATYIGAQQGYLIMSAADGASYSCINEWCDVGVPPLKDFIQHVPFGTWSWTERCLANDQVVKFSTPADLPEEAVQERNSPTFDMGYTSSIIVPINSDGLQGSIAISSYQKVIIWQDSDIRHLKVVGDAIANFIDRQNAEDEIRNLNSSLEHRISDRTADLEAARKTAIRVMHEVDEQRRRAEEALKKLELTTEHLRLLSQAVDNSPAMVMITDKSLHIEYVNPKYSEVTGYSPDEIYGQYPVFVREGQDRLNIELMTALAEGRPWSGEISSRRKSGDVYWEYASFAPIVGAAGHVSHYVAVKEDITERRAMQDELRLARDAAEAANRTKSLFLANMSHEIRTPMNAILGFSQLLQNNHTFRDVEKQHLDIINRSGEHLLALINDILEMSKIEAGRVELNLGIVDLMALISDLSIMFRMRCADKNISFAVEQIGRLPEFVNSDENKLRQILTNLLGNAVKLTESGGVILRVSVGTTSLGSKCFIAEVDDTGPGIADNERSKVFKPFEQTSSGIRSRSGTGLGLAISVQFAQIMGGDIKFESQVGIGTTFKLIVPVNITTVSRIPVMSSKMRVAGLAPLCNIRKVLVVDDEPENRTLMSSMLKDVGFETAEANNGSIAFERFKEWKPDIVLMDAQMPEMDGYEAIRKIRTTHLGKKVPIIGVSASAFEEDRRKMLEAGANEFVSKPLRVDNLYSVIGTVSGATYRYIDIGGSTSGPAINVDAPKIRRIISALPIDVSAKIKQATINADFDMVIELVDQLPNLDSEAADALRTMAEQYEATRIISLLSPEI